jgi:hypothetical protein
VYIQYTYADSWLLMKLMSELLRSKSVPIVVSHVATESFVTREESPLLAEMTPRKHNASVMRCRSRYMQIFRQYVQT